MAQLTSSTNVIGKILSINLNLPANKRNVFHLHIFDRLWPIDFVENAADAAINLNENACLDVGDEVYIYGAGACPQEQNAEFTISERVSGTQFRMGFDASIHGSSSLGGLGVINKANSYSYIPKLYFAKETAAKVSGANKLTRIDNHTVIAPNIIGPVNRVMIDSLEYTVEGMSAVPVANCANGKGAMAIKVKEVLPANINSLSAWEAVINFEEEEEAEPIRMSKVNYYLWAIEFEATPRGTRIYNIQRYLGGFIQDWTINGFVNFI